MTYEQCDEPLVAINVYKLRQNLVHSGNNQECPLHQSYVLPNDSGGCYLPEAQSGRFFVGFYWMSCMVIVATYSGNLIAFLTVSKDVLPFDTLEGMADQNEYRFGYIGGTALDHYIRVSYFHQNCTIFQRLHTIFSNQL